MMRRYEQACPRGSIGPAGVAARVLVGSALIVGALFWWGLDWWDPFVAVGFAALIGGLLAARASRDPAPVVACGPIASVVTVLVAIALMLLPATSGGALLFYGGTMLVAAARRQAGCEVTVVSNAVLGRRDEIGCALFAPVDLVERAYLTRSRAEAPGA